MIGLAAVAVSVWLLYQELRGISFAELRDSLSAIPAGNWLLAGASTVVAYAALAGYDHIALLHLRRRVSWIFVTLASFTAYALSHNIGASVLSGAVVRYRAYTSRGLTVGEIGVLVAFCSFTFALGSVLLTGVVLVLRPDIVERFVDVLPLEASATTGCFLLALVGLYVLGSWLHLKPMRLARVEIHYPRLPIVLRQLVIGPLELLAAAAIVYFSLPAQGNPGYVVVLGIFIISFSIALISHAPGGIGVLELAFLTGLPELNEADVLAALIVFRLLYLIVPFVLSLFVILIFERAEYGRGEGQDSS